MTEFKHKVGQKVGIRGTVYDNPHLIAILRSEPYIVEVSGGKKMRYVNIEIGGVIRRTPINRIIHDEFELKGLGIYDQTN